MSNTERVLREIQSERERQKSVEGWTEEHDDEHDKGEMADAAACYARFARSENKLHVWPLGWPWSREWWKPKDERRDLIRAAALIVAFLDVLVVL